MQKKRCHAISCVVLDTIPATRSRARSDVVEALRRNWIPAADRDAGLRMKLGEPRLWSAVGDGIPVKLWGSEMY